MKKIVFPLMLASFFAFTCLLRSQEEPETNPESTGVPALATDALDTRPGEVKQLQPHPAAPEVQPPTPSEYYLGVQCSPVPELLDMHLNLDGKGQLVRLVVPDSAADKAGIKPGDLLLSIGGRDIESLRDIFDVLAADKDKEQTLGVLQKGKTTEIKVVPEKRPETTVRTLPAPSGMFRTIQPGIIFEHGRDEDPHEMIRKFIEKMGGTDFPADIADPQGLLGTPGDEHTERIEVSIMPGTEPGTQRIHVRHNNEVWDVERIEDLPKEMQERVRSIIVPMHGDAAQRFFSRKTDGFPEKADERLEALRRQTARDLRELEAELKKAHENSPDLRKKFDDYRGAMERYFGTFRESDTQAQPESRPQTPE